MRKKVCGQAVTMAAHYLPLLATASTLVAAPEVRAILAMLFFNLRKVHLQVVDEYFTLGDMTATNDRVSHVARGLALTVKASLRSPPKLTTLNASHDMSRVEADMSLVAHALTLAAKWPPHLVSDQQGNAVVNLSYHSWKLFNGIGKPVFAQVQFDFEIEHVEKFATLVKELFTVSSSLDVAALVPTSPTAPAPDHAENVNTPDKKAA